MGSSYEEDKAHIATQCSFMYLLETHIGVTEAVKNWLTISAKEYLAKRRLVNCDVSLRCDDIQEREIEKLYAAHASTQV